MATSSIENDGTPPLDVIRRTEPPASWRHYQTKRKAWVPVGEEFEEGDAIDDGDGNVVGRLDVAGDGESVHWSS